MIDKPYITIVETTIYLNRSKKLLSDEERESIVTLLAMTPEIGVLIQGTGGVRKVRIALEGGGKSSGARVIYFFHNTDMPIYLLTIFAKNRKISLSRKEKNALKILTEQLIKHHKGKPHDK